MSFIQDSIKINLGQSIKNSYDNALLNIDAAQKGRSDIFNKLEEMKTSSEYTSDDIKEVQSLLDILNSKINL